MKLISVLMSTYKEPKEYVKLAIESIINQTYKNIEFIIIIDDPQNANMIKLLYDYQKNDNRIKIIKNDENIGLVDSLNKGLSMCNGDLIARMDADDISVPSRIEKELNFLQTHNYDMVSSNVLQFTTDHTKDMKRIFPELHEDCLLKLQRNACLPHPAWLVKREVYEKLQGYRNIFSCEDYDFVLRAIFNGFKIGNCQEVLLKYRYNENSISRKNVISQMIISNYLATQYKNDCIITIKQYKEYLDSEEYRKKEKSLEKYYIKKNKYVNSKSHIKKIIYGANIFFDSCFWKIKMKKNI